MTPIDEAQLKDPFIHTVEFGLDGIAVTFENQADITEMVKDRISREIVCEGHDQFENLYAELQDILRKIIDEAAVIKRNPEF